MIFLKILLKRRMTGTQLAKLFNVFAYAHAYVFIYELFFSLFSLSTFTPPSPILTPVPNRPLVSLAKQIDCA